MKQAVPRPKFRVVFEWKIALCVLILFVVFIRLGIWQLDRAQQKRQIQSDRSALQKRLPISVESINLDNKSSLNGLKVILDGSFDDHKSLFVSNQMFQGRLGYEVMTVFRLRASDKLVLVSRGWTAVIHNNKQLPAIEEIIGHQQLIGNIYLLPSHSFFLPQKFDKIPKWPLRLHHFELSDISRLFDKPLLPFVVRLAQNSPGVLLRHWRVSKLKPENSTSYAIQWFSMAMILIVMSIIKSTNIIEMIRYYKMVKH